MALTENIFNPEEFYLMETHTPTFSCVNFSKTLQNEPLNKVPDIDMNLAFGPLKKVDDKFCANVIAVTVAPKGDKNKSQKYVHYSDAEKEAELSKRKEIFAQ